MKFFKYLRYSSDPQEHGSSIERQTEVIDKFIATRPDFEEELPPFIDDGYSASKGEHLRDGEFGRILSDADTGKYRGYGMIVEKMDRFSRMDYEETAGYVKRLTKGGVQLYLAASGRLVNPPGDKQLGNIIVNVVEAWQAEDYVKNLTANVKRGWKRIMDEAANGRVLTRRVPKWLRVVDRTYNGAKIINPGRIIEVPEMVAVVREMFLLAAQGVGSENITRALKGKVLSRGWIVTTLRNRAVLGEFQPGGSGKVIQKYFPQIVSQTEFDDAGRQMDAKRICNHYAGGNKRNSATGANLFSGYLFDRDPDHVRSMHFQTAERGSYVMSPSDLVRWKSNRIRYNKLEKAILGFLETRDWQAIAGESESDECKAARTALEAKRRLADAVSREITSNIEAMQGEDVDTRRLFMRENAKHEAVLTHLTEEIKELQATVDQAQAKTADLAETKTFLESLNQLNSNPALRLRAKVAIQKKVSRIELVFMPDHLGAVAFLQYRNGARDTTIVLNKDIDENAPWFSTMPPALRTSGLFRIQRIRNKAPKFHETLKADVLKWVRDFAEPESELGGIQARPVENTSTVNRSHPFVRVQ